MKKGNIIGKKSKLDITYMIVMIVVLSVFALILIGIFIWGLLTALKTDFDFMTNKIGFPTEWTFENFVLAVKHMDYWINNGSSKVYIETMYLNSILYAAGGAFFCRARAVRSCLSYRQVPVQIQ